MNRISIALGLLICLTLLVQGIAADRARITVEGCGQVMHAWSMAEGRLTTPFFTGDVDHRYPPLYPALICITHAMIGSWTFAAKAVTVIFCGLLALAAYFLGRKLFQWEAGLYASALVISLPLFILLGSDASPVPIFLFVLALSMLWAWRMMEDQKPVFAILCGISLGLAYLTMTQALVFLVPVVFCTLFLVRRIRSAMLLVLVLVFFSLFAVPYMYYSGTWMVNTGSVVSLNEATLNREATSLIHLESGNHLTDLAALYETTPVLLMICLLFLVIPRKGRSTAHLYLFFWAFPPMLLLWLFYGLSLPTICIGLFPLLVWAGRGVQTLREGIEALFKRRAEHPTALWGILLFAIVILHPEGQLWNLPSHDPTPLEEEAQWLDEQISGTGRRIVMSPDPYLPLEAGHYWYLLPADYLGRISLYARAQETDFVLWQSSRETPVDHWDQFRSPFDKFGLTYRSEGSFGEDPPSFNVLYAVAEEETVEERPNIILVSIDTLRADHLSCYGYQRDTSPELDRLASEGVRFEKVISHAPQTSSSHMTLFTSTWLEVHGVRQLVKEPRFLILPDSLKTLTEVLKEDGYRTAAFTGGSQVAGGFGFERGFEIYESNMGYRLFPDSFEPVHEWLSQLKQNERFFLFLHTYQVHGPYCPPAPYNKMYDPEYEGWIEDDWDDRMAQLNNDDGHKHSKRDMEHLEALYDGEIRYTDDLFARFFAELEEKGLFGDRNTLVVITSDHGEEFLEHGKILHQQLYREIMEVPLIFYWPGVLPAGVVVPGQVRLIDVAPTILELAGFPAIPQTQGVSLKSVLFSGMEVNLSAYSTNPAHPNRSALRSDRWMYYKKGADRYELYDMQLDPGEEANFLETKGELPVNEELLRGDLKTYRDSGRKLKSIFNIGEPGVFDIRAGKANELSEEQVQRLRELGYL